MYQGQQPQQPLPGAYYGPAVPPKQAKSCSTAIKILIAAMILLGVLVIVLWLALRPSDIKFRVTSASLAQFNLTSSPGDGNNNLLYNLTTVVSIRNPNKRVGVYYDWLEATAEFEGERFAWTPLPSFYQGHKNTTTLYPSFAGSSAINLSGSDVSDFGMQQQAGAFEVTLRLRARYRFKIRSIKTRRTTMKVRCYLTVPRAGTGRSFSETKCKVDW
uniref:Putative syntaxin-24 n=1 Tax=Anthurium amnicola TaxID=1678845 RepID=A0A1D1YLU0_9ARAE